MASQHITGLAALVALTFLIMALASCASTEQTVVQAEPIDIASAEPPPGIPEFHGAHIGADTLRDRLAAE